MNHCKSIAGGVLKRLHRAAREKAPDDRSAASIHVLLGPVVQRPVDEDDCPEFYFVVTGGTEKTPSNMCVGGAEREYPVAFRQALCADLPRQPPLVIHDFSDELEMAQWAAAIWPCEQTHRILATIKQERRLSEQPAKEH